MKIQLDFDTGLTLTIQLEDNEFTPRWCKLLEAEISKDTLLQEDTFSCFFNEEQSRRNLEKSIVKVNQFLKTEFIPLPTVNDYNDANYYNVLHSLFEKLAGPDWDSPTRLMVIAPNDVKLAVRHINRYCHRLEQQPYSIEPEMRVEFDTFSRQLFETSDYDLFKDYELETDIVLLDYSTLGKSLIECYDDHLPPNYAGLKIQHHYSPNFILKFGQVTRRRPRDKFKEWLLEHNLTDLPNSVFGNIKLGVIVEKNLLQSVQESAKILKIRLE